MFKRKSNYGVSYTGVDRVPLPAQEPDSGAQAAARSIGESLKKAQPHVYGAPQPQQPNTAQQPRNSSLLKRSPSIASNKPKATFSLSASSRSLAKKVPANQRHSIPVTNRVPNNGSGIIGESTRLSSLDGNEARIRDLKLQHLPQQPVPRQAPVKMIKKYIPTPNGIQIVEVPESSFKQEIARSNSMRSGLSVRSGLLTKTQRAPSLNSASGHRLKLQTHARKGPGLRLSSFTNEPSIAEEPDLLADNREETIRRLKEASNLKSEIEREKQRARDLEKQKLEYEQLESLRAQNDKMYRELQTLKEKELSPPQTSQSVYSESPSGTIDPKLVNYTEATHPDHFIDFSALADQAEDGDDEADVPIVPVPHAVDEVDLKRALNGYSALGNRDSFVSSAYTLDDVSSQEHPTITSELEVLESYEHGHHDLDEGRDFGIEEVAVDSFHSPILNKESQPVFDPLSAQLTGETGERTVLPTFDPVPEVIGGTVASLNVASSIRSVSSLDSKSRPIKSAMKNSKVKYTTAKPAVVSPAEQAYLSLTTAENTRLNSKLSASQLNEEDSKPLPTANPTVKSPVPSNTSTPQKRMSQSLRKQPSLTSPSPGGMSTRPVRPRRHSDIPTGKGPESSKNSQYGGGMSSRLFRNEPPKPIAQHPALSPNYESPSKKKAAALYAKANMRPISHFEPSLRRKSSFSRETEDQHENSVLQSPKPTQPHMKSLRTSSNRVPTISVVEPTRTIAKSGPSAVAALTPGKVPSSTMKPKETAESFATPAKFTSKILDSDDEDGGVPIRSSARPSRFADSDDEAPSKMQTQTLREATIKPVRDSKIPTMLRKEEAPKEEKKKKKNRLKKLFGFGK